METSHPLDLISHALELIDAALTTLAAAHASALHAGLGRLAGDVLVLGDALDREADALYAAWQRAAVVPPA